MLSEREQRLFDSMTVRDRQHCLDVYRRLRAQGHDDRELLSAAILHDAGKGQIALWHRVAYVLLETGAPGILGRLAVPGTGPAWREALYRCRHHPELGAERARAAGASTQVIALIRAVDDTAMDERQLALQSADDAR